MDDRELDAQIAEKVTLWTLIPGEDGWQSPDGSIKHWPGPPEYSSSIKDAMEVVNCLRSKGVGIQITMPSHAKEYVWIEMNVPSSECQEWGNILPKAICKCALKAFDHFSLASRR